MLNRTDRPQPMPGEAEIKYLDGDFRIVRPGAFVRCAVTGVPIPLEELRYWSVDLQEPYATPEAVLQHQALRLQEISVQLRALSAPSTSSAKLILLLDDKPHRQRIGVLRPAPASSRIAGKPHQIFFGGDQHQIVLAARAPADPAPLPP